MPARMILAISYLVVTVIAFAGCRKAEEPPKKDAVRPVVQAKKDNDGKLIQARTTARAKGPALLPFKQAVILGNDAPVGELPPPDLTCTGKSTVKLFEMISNDLWDKAAFTDSEGKRVRYKAIITTDLGDIHVDLLGDSAPNHVRSFVCLARAGYHDGMSFYRSVKHQVGDANVAYIETGCPLGTGELGSGSIGYWLRPEIDRKLSHEEGVLSAYQGNSNSAACRFNITATAMPHLDGTFTIFGKVTRGLDIVRTINRRDVQENDLLNQPVLIRSVTIQTVPD